MKKFLIIFILIIDIVYARESLIFTVPVEIKSDKEKKILEFFTRVLDNLGYDLKLEVLPGERALQTANSGKVDGEFARVAGVEKKYKNLIMVPEVIADIEFYVYGIKDYKFKNIQDIIDSEVNIINITGEKYISEKIKPFIDSERYEEVPRIENALRVVNYRKNGILISSEYIVGDLIEKENLNEIFVSERPVRVEHLYPYLHIKNIELLPKIRDEMRVIKKQTNY